MKKLILLALALLLGMTACQKEELFTLRMEPYEDGVIGMALIPWSDGDAIWLNGDKKDVASIGPVATIEAHSKTASFTAVYPYDWVRNDGTAIEYPATQTYREYGFDSPMATYNDDASDQVVNLHNLGSVLIVTVTNTSAVDVPVESIVVTATDGKKINGTYTINASDYSLTPVTEGTSTMTLTCSPAVNIPKKGRKTFFIAMPPVEAKLTIEVNDGFYSSEVGLENDLTFERNHCHSESLNFSPKNNELWYTATAEIPSINGLALNAENCRYDASLQKGILTFQNDITSIPEEAFNDNKTLTSCTLPTSVTSIEDYAFLFCTNMNSVEIPAVTSIGNSAFRYCSGLENIDMPNVSAIGKHAFQMCIHITSLDMPKVGTINDSAFNNCSRLNTIDLYNVSNMGNAVFSGYAEMNTVNWHRNTPPDYNASILNFECITGSPLITLHVPKEASPNWGNWWCYGPVEYDL